jgi:hypothetical protein
MKRTLPRLSCFQCRGPWRPLVIFVDSVQGGKAVLCFVLQTLISWLCTQVIEPRRQLTSSLCLCLSGALLSDPLNWYSGIYGGPGRVDRRQPRDPSCIPPFSLPFFDVVIRSLLQMCGLERREAFVRVARSVRETLFSVSGTGCWCINGQAQLTIICPVLQCCISGCKFLHRRMLDHLIDCL